MKTTTTTNPPKTAKQLVSELTLAFHVLNTYGGKMSRDEFASMSHQTLLTAEELKNNYPTEYDAFTKSL